MAHCGQPVTDVFTYAFLDLLAPNADRLAEVEIRDNGKLLAEMRGQFIYHPEWWRHFEGLVDKIEGSVVPIDKPDIFALTRHEPIGVVAALTAWNSPRQGLNEVRRPMEGWLYLVTGDSPRGCFLQ